MRNIQGRILAKAPLGQTEFNTIQNSRKINMTAQANFKSNKVPFLKR